MSGQSRLEWNVERYSLYLAWLLALVATLGSLFASNVLDWTPCTLCWYQRIMMYPLAVILGIATWKQDRLVTRYALPLSVAGLALAVFQYLEQFTRLDLSRLCQPTVPCSGHYLLVAGFITVPFLSALAFLSISLLLIMVWHTGT